MKSYPGYFSPPVPSADVAHVSTPDRLPSSQDGRHANHISMAQPLVRRFHPLPAYGSGIHRGCHRVRLQRRPRLLPSSRPVRVGRANTSRVRNLERVAVQEGRATIGVTRLLEDQESFTDNGEGRAAQDRLKFDLVSSTDKAHR